MKIVEGEITLIELKTMSAKMFDNLVKAVIDIEKKILILDAELHSDMEYYLINHGSRQENLWGINIYPELPKDQRIEYDSMINLRPSWGNNSRGVDSKEIQGKIAKIVNSKIIDE